MNIFDGKDLADKIAAHIKKEVTELAVKPKLVIFAVQPNEQSKAYIAAKLSRAQELGIETQYIELMQATTKQLVRKIQTSARDKTVSGIMLQLPLIRSIDQTAAIAAIPPEKDVDGMRFLSLKNPLFAPATSLAVLAALELSGAKPKTSRVVIVGQGEVGKPLSMILKKYGIMVTTIAQADKSLASKTTQADVLISAVGKPHLITSDHIKDGAVVIDVGVTIQDGKTSGDVDFAKSKEKASFITPPLGGIGPVTVVMLMQNVILAAKRQSST